MAQLGAADDMQLRGRNYAADDSGRILVEARLMDHRRRGCIPVVCGFGACNESDTAQPAQRHCLDDARADWNDKAAQCASGWS